MLIPLQMSSSLNKPWECEDLELVPLDTKVTAEALLRHPRGVAGLSRMVGVESKDLVPLLKDPVYWETGTYKGLQISQINSSQINSIFIHLGLINTM